MLSAETLKNTNSYVVYSEINELPEYTYTMLEAPKPVKYFKLYLVRLVQLSFYVHFPPHSLIVFAGIYIYIYMDGYVRASAGDGIRSWSTTLPKASWDSHLMCMGEDVRV